MNQDKVVSVIVPVYNAEQYLKKCVNSIINQTYHNLEILLINDGSTDQSKSICEKYQRQDSRIKVISIENQGVSSARNLGIENASGYYITFADADDWLEIEEIYTMIENMICYEVDLSICNHYWNYENGRVFVNQSHSYLMNTIQFFKDVLDKNLFHGFLWNKLFKMEIIKKNKIKFDTEISVFEDLKFVCDYAKYISSAYYDGRPFYHYLQRNSSALHLNKGKNYFSSITVCEYLIELYDGICKENVYLAKEKYIRTVFDCLYKVNNKDEYYNNIKMHKEKAKKTGRKILSSYSKKDKTDLYILINFPYFHELLRRLWIRCKPYVKSK